MESIKQLFMAIQNFWETGGVARYYLLVIPAFAIIYMIFAIVQNNARVKKVNEFKSNHPDAASILLKAGGTFITPHSMYLQHIAGQDPVWEIVGGRHKYWFTPGEHEISASYAKTRPGILYRSVTKTYGPVKMKVELEANKSYMLRFVKDEFELSEM